MMNYINKSKVITEGLRKSFQSTHHHDAIISAQDFETLQRIVNARTKCPVQEMKMTLSF